ncbi:MAG: hypothetical protein JO264_08440 [Acidisphaera sp.]|nr:hypothetical protein [Acidisphaera sp.]
MRSATTVHSLPGDWVDRHGRPQPPVLVRRIVVLKADHIGDLLIAGQAFSLLRHYFPEAAIDLICGTWNVGLAQRMDLFDRVFGADVFHEISGVNADPQVKREARRDGISALERLELGRYDLAIDLRYDRDTRTVLPTIDARIYAGFGTTREFPFLDVVLPMHEGAEPEPPGCPYEAVLGSQDFATVAPNMPDSRPTPGRRSGRMRAEKTELDIELTIFGAKSPRACGLSRDERLLGVALEHLTVAPETAGTDPAAIHLLRPGHPDLALLSGWGSPEPFGVWTIARKARLSVLLPDDLAGERINLGLSLQAHVNPANPIVGCTIRVLADDAVRLAMFDRDLPEQTVTMSAARHGQTCTLRSDPLRLGAGDYGGTLRLYIPVPILDRMEFELVVRGVDSGTLLLRRAIGSDYLKQGSCILEFGFEIEQTGEAITLEVTANDAALFAGTRIEMMHLLCLQRQKFTLPVGHMEHWASLLVFRVAQMFSRRDMPGSRHVPRALTRETGSELVQTMRTQMREWQEDGKGVIGLALGCNSEIRKWPFHYFLELATELLRRGRLELVFIGGPADREEAASACRQLGLDEATHSLCGRVDLADLGAVLGGLDLFIGSNTGTTHYAGKAGVRTIGIYAGTNHPREWAPIGPNASWIYRDEPCAPCHLIDLRDCRFAHSCLVELTPDRVMQVLEPELLALRSKRPAPAPPEPPAQTENVVREALELGSPA